MPPVRAGLEANPLICQALRVTSRDAYWEDLPSEWAKEDREIEGGKPDLAEVEEDPSEL